MPLLDVAIPLASGLLFLLRPGLFCRDPARAAAAGRLRRLRWIGGVLVAASAIYLAAAMAAAP